MTYMILVLGMKRVLDVDRTGVSCLGVRGGDRVRRPGGKARLLQGPQGALEGDARSGTLGNIPGRQAGRKEGTGASQSRISAKHQT